MLGLFDIARSRVVTAEEIAARLRQALGHIRSRRVQP